MRQSHIGRTARRGRKTNGREGKAVSDKCILVADIGGTNARFALANTDVVGYRDARTYSCADFDTADLAIQDYLLEVGAAQPSVICIAVAGPVVDQTVRMTNNHWSMSGSALSVKFSDAKVSLLNDFEAVAYSLPHLADGDTHAIGLPDARPKMEGDFTVAAIGPGTGLGCATLVGRKGTIFPIMSEGSHSGFAPESQVQFDILAMLRSRFDRVSDERLVSGTGMTNLYWALSKLHNEDPRNLTAADIFELGISGADTRAEESVQLFFELLGQMAGNLALTVMATDGVFIAGGIVQRYTQIIENSRFRSGFENKGRYRSLMERIPTRLITHASPGLVGASFYALKMSTA